MTERERSALAEAYPRDFVSDETWDFTEALATAKGDGVKNMSITASRMPKSGGVKNMAKQKTESGQFSVPDKIKYFTERVGDSTLSKGQRKYAAKRLGELCGGGQAPQARAPKATTQLTPQQNNARMAGLGFGVAKEGGRILVKDENKPSFRDGVKEGKALAKKQKRSF